MWTFPNMSCYNIYEGTHTRDTCTRHTQKKEKSSGYKIFLTFCVVYKITFLCSLYMLYMHV